MANYQDPTSYLQVEGTEGKVVQEKGAREPTFIDVATGRQITKQGDKWFTVGQQGKALEFVLGRGNVGGFDASGKVIQSPSLETLNVQGIPQGFQAEQGKPVFTASSSKGNLITQYFTQGGKNYQFTVDAGKLAPGTSLQSIFDQEAAKAVASGQFAAQAGLPQAQIQQQQATQAAEQASQARGNAPTGTGPQQALPATAEEALKKQQQSAQNQGTAPAQQPAKTGETKASSAPLGQQLNIQRNLGPGSSGEDVKQLQNFLIQQGFQIQDGATGYYGPQTKTAVEQWQRKSGIQAPSTDYGYFGPLSRNFVSQPPSQTGTEATTGGGTPISTEPELTQTEVEYKNHLETKTFKDYVTTLSKEAGLDTLTQNIKDANKQLQDLRDKKADDANLINNNPWISDAERIRKLGNLDSKYEQKEANLQGALQIAQKQFDDAQAEVNLVAKMAIDQANRDREFEMETKKFAESLKTTKQKESTTTQTQVVNVGNRQVLINKQTGETIRDLGPTSTTKTSTEIAGLDKDINNLMGGLSPEQLDQLISLGLI